MRFGLRALLLYIALAAVFLALVRHMWSEPSLVSRPLIAITCVLLGAGAVLAVTPPWPRRRRRPSWSVWIPRAILWGGAFGILALRSHLEYLVFIAVQAVMIATPIDLPDTRVPIVERLYHAIAASAVSLLVGLFTAIVLHALQQRVRQRHSERPARLWGWSVAALTGIGGLAAMTVYHVKVTMPLLSSPYSEAFELTMNPLDLGIIALGFLGLAGGIAARQAWVDASGDERQEAATLGWPLQGKWYQAGWLCRLIVGSALIAPGVLFVLNQWEDGLPRNNALTFVAPQSADELLLPLDASNVFSWLLVAAALVSIQAVGGAVCAALFRPSEFVSARRFSAPLFLLWWAFLTVGSLAAIPALGVLIIPAWHLYLLHS